MNDTDPGLAIGDERAGRDRAERAQEPGGLGEATGTRAGGAVELAARPEDGARLAQIAGEYLRAHGIELHPLPGVHVRAI